MHTPLRRLTALMLSLLLLGTSAATFANEAADRTALEAAAQAWVKAFNARDAATLSTFVTEDVVLLDPSIPAVVGQSAARAAWHQAFSLVNGQVTTATKEVVIAGEVAWRIGALAHTLPDAEVASRGQCLEIWKRVNSKWKMHRQMSSSLLAPPKKLLPRPPLSEPVLDAPRN